MAKRAGHPLFFCCERDQLQAPLDLDAAGSQVLIQHRLGLRLRDEQQERVRGVLEPDVEEPRAHQLPPGMHLQLHRVVATLDQPLRDAEAPQNLKRPWQHDQRTRLVHAIELTIDDPDRGTERVELRGQRKARGAGTDDQNARPRAQLGAAVATLDRHRLDNPTRRLDPPVAQAPGRSAGHRASKATDRLSPRRIRSRRATGEVTPRCSSRSGCLRTLFAEDLVLHGPGWEY